MTNLILLRKLFIKDQDSDQDQDHDFTLKFSIMIYTLKVNTKFGIDEQFFLLGSGSWSEYGLGFNVEI